MADMLKRADIRERNRRSRRRGNVLYARNGYVSYIGLSTDVSIMYYGIEPAFIYEIRCNGVVKLATELEEIYRLRKKYPNAIVSILPVR